MFKKINIQFLISYFGLIPYAIVFLDKYYFLKIKEEILLNQLLHYLLLDLAFLPIFWDQMDVLILEIQILAQIK